jgi:hypothetical protein
MRRDQLTQAEQAHIYHLACTERLLRWVRQRGFNPDTPAALAAIIAEHGLPKAILHKDGTLKPTRGDVVAATREYLHERKLKGGR